MGARRFFPASVWRLVGVAAVLSFPWFPGVSIAMVTNANLAGQYSIIAISLVVLTGWVGQISLAQATFVGIGAFTTGLLARSAHIPFPANLPIVAIISAGVASLLGLIALRVRGLYLAVATLIFAWMGSEFLFNQTWLVGSGGSSSIVNRPIGLPGSVTHFDLSSPQVFYLIMVAAVAGVIFAAVNLRESKTGRAFFAVRGSETAAVSLGIDVTRYKLLAFALSGALAGIAGNLIMTDLRSASPTSFDFVTSLFFLSIAIVGGITSLPGAVAAGVLFAGLDQLFFQVAFLKASGARDIARVLLLLIVMVAYPSGLSGMANALRAWVRKILPMTLPYSRRLAKRRTARAEKAEVTEPVLERSRPRLRLPAMPALLKRVIRRRSRSKVTRRSLDLTNLQVLEPEPTVEELALMGASQVEHKDWRSMELKAFPLPPAREDRTPILEAEHVVVQFGGLRAVDDVSVIVREHEIVGLIGPNGAGKTTTFNAISGLNEPTGGTVKLFGEDATHLPVHVRAQMGVGRTFQLIQLFPQLSVFENLLVATHTHNETGVASHVLLTDKAIEAERASRQQVRQIVALLGLEDVADRRIAGLPFGILRQVEIARALVTRAPFLMLDEPASGLDNAETDELAQLLYFIRAQLGVSILLIEHDVRMVTSVCDYMYVINRGKPLAEGTPLEIQRNPEVVAAYLGGAIAEEEMV